jgi:hypothetical protein
VQHSVTSAVVLALTLALTAPAVAFDGYHLESSTMIEGKGVGYDYLTLDPSGKYLYIGHRGEGLQVFDLAAKRVVSTIANSDGSNGGTLIAEFDLGISNNETGSITPFKLSTGEAMPQIKLGKELDDSWFDPATKRLAVKMGAEGDTSEIVWFELPALKQIGATKTPSKRLDGSVMDGKGNFYVDTRDTNSVLRVDTRSMQVTAQWKIDGCEVASGMDIDTANNRLFVGCRGKGNVKPILAVIDLASGKTVYTSEIGRQNDGVIYDAETKRIFTANGVDAVLVIFEQKDADNYAPLEALATLPGVRTIAMDPKTKKIYSITAEGSADFSKKVNTAVGPFYPNTFFPNTFRVLTYTKR